MPSTGCGLAPADQPGQTAERDILVDALARSYRLHLPAGYHTDTPTPLLLAFHGYTGTSASAEKSMQFSPHADEHGYIAVYPQATFFDSAGTVITSWNDLACNASPGPAGPICAADAYPYPFPPNAARLITATGAPATTTSPLSPHCSTRWKTLCALTSTGSTLPA